LQDIKFIYKDREEIDKIVPIVLDDADDTFIGRLIVVETWLDLWVDEIIDLNLKLQIRSKRLICTLGNNSR